MEINESVVISTLPKEVEDIIEDKVTSIHLGDEFITEVMVEMKRIDPMAEVSKEFASELCNAMFGGMPQSDIDKMEMKGAVDSIMNHYKKSILEKTPDANEEERDKRILAEHMLDPTSGLESDKYLSDKVLGIVKEEEFTPVESSFKLPPTDVSSTVVVKSIKESEVLHFYDTGEVEFENRIDNVNDYQTKEDIFNAEGEFISPIIHEDKLQYYRGINDLSGVLSRASSPPDKSILSSSNISSGVKRLELYQNSSITNGFKIFLPYSGYEVIVKKILNKNKLSYFLSYLDKLSDTNVIETIIEQECYKILFEHMVIVGYPNIEYSEWTRNFAEADLPIIMTAFAMTNITPTSGSDMVKVPITKLKCANINCSRTMSIDERNIDLVDIMSKIYPPEAVVASYAESLKSKVSLESAFRSSLHGNLNSIRTKDESGVTSNTMLYSKPTVYKVYSIRNQLQETIYRLAQNHIIENGVNYSNNEVGKSDLVTFMTGLSFSEYLSKKELVSSQMEILRMDKQRETEISINSSADYSMLLSTEEKKSLGDEIGKYYPMLALVYQLLEEKALEIEEDLHVMQYLDVVRIHSLNEKGEPDQIIAEVSSHDNLYDLIALYSEMPKTLIEALHSRIVDMKLEESKILSENMFFNAVELKGKISSDYMDRFRPSTEADYISDVLSRRPDTSEDEMASYLVARKAELELLEEGKCTCGSSKFYINYIHIIFFSVLKRSEVMIKR